MVEGRSEARLAEARVVAIPVRFRTPPLFRVEYGKMPLLLVGAFFIEPVSDLVGLSLGLYYANIDCVLSIRNT